MTAHTRRVYSITEAAQALGIHRTSLYRLINAGSIPTVRVTPGRQVITVEALESYIASRTAA